MASISSGIIQIIERLVCCDEKLTMMTYFMLAYETNLGNYLGFVPEAKDAGTEICDNAGFFSDPTSFGVLLVCFVLQTHAVVLSMVGAIGLFCVLLLNGVEASWDTISTNNHRILNAGEPPKVIIATVETRDIKETLIGRFWKKSPEFVQIGLHKKWDGFQTKVVLLYDYLHSLNKTRPNQIVAFTDSDAILNPIACNVNEIYKRYQELRKASGYDVFFAAEVNQYEYGGDVPSAPAWAKKLSPYARNINGAKKYMTDSARKSYNQGGAIYLNSGGFIGPVHKLVDAVMDAKMQFFPQHKPHQSTMIEVSSSVSAGGNGDQHKYWEYFIHHQDVVTLDYAAKIFHPLALFDVKSRLTLTENGNLYDNWLHQYVCFAHCNSWGTKKECVKYTESLKSS